MNGKIIRICKLSLLFIFAQLMLFFCISSNPAHENQAESTDNGIETQSVITIPAEGNDVESINKNTNDESEKSLVRSFDLDEFSAGIFNADSIELTTELSSDIKKDLSTLTHDEVAMIQDLLNSMELTEINVGINPGNEGYGKDDVVYEGMLNVHIVIGDDQLFLLADNYEHILATYYHNEVVAREMYIGDKESFYKVLQIIKI